MALKLETVSMAECQGSHWIHEINADVERKTFERKNQIELFNIEQEASFYLQT